MTRYFINISYKGTNYNGWQVQPNGITIQGKLNECLSTILQEEITVIGAGRTDTGVHANFFFGHFDSKCEDLDKNLQLVYKLNKILPLDIKVNHINVVRNDAHARFDAISRAYRYYLIFEKDPFGFEYAYYLEKKPDIDLMNQAAEVLFDYNDFTSFSKVHTDVKTNNCNIMQAYWQDAGNKMIFSIRADRFLRNMVRAIVGTMLDIGYKKKGVEEMKTIIEQKNRSSAGYSVPAKGLFLENITYPEDFFK